MNEELDVCNFITLSPRTSLHHQTTETFDKFLQAQSNRDEDAVRILHPLCLRYFSPAELLRLFNFDLPHHDVPRIPNEISSPFVWPKGVTRKAKFRLIGNSVNVRVVKELINFLFE